MIVREFFDTNILLYAKIDDSSEKHIKAKDLLMDRILNGSPCLSVQIINEFTVNAVKKGKELPVVKDIVSQLLESFTVFPLTVELTMDAFRLSNRYKFSFWDSLIAAAALKAQCSVLFTEDLQDGQIIDGVLEIKNPFAKQNKA
jgi:predicted nucleic acid-binding protein